MNTGSLPLGSWFGIRVNIHWSVLIIAMLLAASLADLVGLLPAVVGVIAFLASILVHEFAHALTARRFGVGTQSIQLWALGGVARLDRESPTARAEGSLKRSMMSVVTSPTRSWRTPNAASSSSGVASSPTATSVAMPACSAGSSPRTRPRPSGPVTRPSSSWR